MTGHTFNCFERANRRELLVKLEDKPLPAVHLLNKVIERDVAPVHVLPEALLREGASTGLHEHRRVPFRDMCVWWGGGRGSHRIARNYGLNGDDMHGRVRTSYLQMHCSPSWGGSRWSMDERGRGRPAAVPCNPRIASGMRQVAPAREAVDDP